jgi:hypothetical protein
MRLPQETGMEEKNVQLCITCAWRETCQKQFSLKAGQKCAEYSRDLTIKSEVKNEETPAEGESRPL